MAEPLKIIQVGLGGWGRDWSHTLAKHPTVATTVAWVDAYDSVLELAQEQLGINPENCYNSLSEALDAVEADAVLVTTALPGHVPVALEALAGGKHVLVEKPMAPSLAEGQKLVEAARAANRTVMVSQNYRFYPAASTVRKLISEGSLGAVGEVDVAFRKYGNSAPVGESGHYTLPDPLLLDMSIHHFDLMRYVLGQEPVKVTCHSWNPQWSKFEDPASAVTTVEFDAGAVVDYRGSWVSTNEPTLWAGHWTIECEGGTIEWTGRNDHDTTEDRVTIHPLGEESYELELPEMTEFDRVGSMAELRNSIHEERAPLTSAADNLTTLALTFGALASSRSEQPETIERDAK